MPKPRAMYTKSLHGVYLTDEEFQLCEQAGGSNFNAWSRDILLSEARRASGVPGLVPGGLCSKCKALNSWWYLGNARMYVCDTCAVGYQANPLGFKLENKKPQDDTATFHKAALQALQGLMNRNDIRGLIEMQKVITLALDAVITDFEIGKKKDS